MKSSWLLADKFENGFGAGWNYPDIILQLLWERKIRNQEAAGDFFNPDYKKNYDPFLFPDMKNAAERILAARDKNEVVFIYADYDADGVPGAVILYTVLKACGITPKIYIPHREKEGYGLNKGAVDYMAEAGAKLFITCDCGITNNEEIAYARSKGIEAIITDHHTLPSKLTEDACAIIHPEVGDYPFKKLSGGGVAFKLAQGLLKTIGCRTPYTPYSKEGVALRPSSGQREALEKWLLDLVAISTVADMMPLTDENRILVHYGLWVLNRTKRLGLRRLIESARINLDALDTHSIGFQIAPRINAAGRMDHANAAFQLLISQDEAEAAQLAENLNKNNSDRQKQTDLIVNEAKFQIVEAGKEKDFCLFAFNSKWPVGLLGLAAGKISDIFNRPTTLLTDSDGKIKGSARSIDQWNVIAALQKISDLFSHFGGHPGAAGLTLKSPDVLEEFKKRLLEIAGAELQDKELEPVVKIDAEIDIDKVDLGLCEIIKKLEPFGEANPRPLFLSRNLEVRGTQLVGNGEKHLRLTVSGVGGRQYKMIGFGFGAHSASLKFGDKIDVVYEIGVNEWNGNKEAQMKIVDMDLMK